MLKFRLDPTVMLVFDGSPIRQVCLQWDMSVSNEACRGLQWVYNQACRSPMGLCWVSDTSIKQRAIIVAIYLVFLHNFKSGLSLSFHHWPCLSIPQWQLWKKKYTTSGCLPKLGSELLSGQVRPLDSMETLDIPWIPTSL